VSRNAVLVTVEGGTVQHTVDLAGTTDVIVIDWDAIDQRSNASPVEALAAIAETKVRLYPWRELIHEAWLLLLETEQGWLEGAESDARLTYDNERMVND
jgi:hypothetical protein